MIDARPTGWFWRARSLVLAAVLVTCCGQLSAQDEVLTEDRIKAAFLFKFGGYVDWPVESFADAGSPFVIGVLGADQVAEDLAGMVAERTINGRSVQVLRIPSGASPAGIHVLFIGRAENDRLAAILEGLASQPVLVVTEADDTSSGGIINFVVVNNKVRFDVMLASAEARNLKISARLLGVARNVVNGSS